MVLGRVGETHTRAAMYTVATHGATYPSRLHVCDNGVHEGGAGCAHALTLFPSHRSALVHASCHHRRRVPRHAAQRAAAAHAANRRDRCRHRRRHPAYAVSVLVCCPLVDGRVVWSLVDGCWSSAASLHPARRRHTCCHYSSRCQRWLFNCCCYSSADVTVVAVSRSVFLSVGGSDDCAAAANKSNAAAALMMWQSQQIRVYAWVSAGSRAACQIDAPCLYPNITKSSRSEERGLDTATRGYDMTT